MSRNQVEDQEATEMLIYCAQNLNLRCVSTNNKIVIFSNIFYFVNEFQVSKQHARQPNQRRLNLKLTHL